jgi:hypothetical protein
VLALVIVDMKNRGGIRQGRDNPETFCVLPRVTVNCFLSENSDFAQRYM